MKENIQLIISVFTLIAFGFAVYKYFRDPDIKSAEEIEKIKLACDFRHKNIDENLLVIKENHLKHLELDVNQLKSDMTKVLTILEERFKK
jgi:hypothetical protein